MRLPKSSSASYVLMGLLLFLGLTFAVFVWKDCRSSGHSVLFCLQLMD